MATKSGALPTLEDQSSTAQALKNRQRTPNPVGGVSIAGSDKVSAFLASERPQTPFLLIDLDVIARNYEALHAALPAADIFYAVKANPAPEIIHLLSQKDSHFDVASRQEIDLVLAAGAHPEKISFGNTIKKENDIAYAFKKGVRLFAFDSEAELEKIAHAAPGALVFCRLLMACDGADWPLSRKFGCEVEMAHDLLIEAHDKGLTPYGVSFHVGSQQTRLDQWDFALEKVSRMFTALERKGVTLEMVNIGGGLPARYKDPVASVAQYGAAIRSAFKKHFGTRLPRVITEPGRSLVGDSGFLETEVMLISRKGYDEDVRWVYLDIGKFGGLAETHDEAIKYRIETLGRKGAVGEVILAGPSCDSVDILYEKYKYRLPLSLKIGDHLRFHSAGAYTASYASVGFNGFPPLKTYCI